MGQSDYAMANAYMDYVAQAHGSALPVVSIQWPNWKQGGRGEARTPTYLKSGFLSLTNAEGLRWLEQILAARPGAVVLPATVDPHLWQADQLMRHAARSRTMTERSGAAAGRQDLERSADTVAGSLSAWLVSLVSRELKIAASNIDVETPLHEYGADSIMLLQILRPISARVGEQLDPSILLEHATIASFARWLSSKYPDAVSDIGETSPVTVTAASPARVVQTKPAIVPEIGNRALTSDIAVVGLSCRFPGANTVDEFWRLLAEGRSAIRAVPKERWVGSQKRFAGLLDDKVHFDPAFFQVSPEDARAMDPQALLLLEEALKVVNHAGYSQQEVKGERIGVYLGARSQHRPDDDALSAARYPIMALGPNYLASNISRFLDLRGPSLVVDTACSSALVAMNAAIQSMRCGEISSALVGGISLLDGDGAMKVFEQRGILNGKSQFHVFDGRANGVILGEGVGLVWLKPAEAALNAGDTIYALIKAVAVNNDGRTASPASPNFQAQRDVMRMALERSGKRPEDISYVEVNGSGSEVTDLLELKALEAEYRPSNGAVCELGSMKPNIGHPLCAEGIASFIKVVLMLHNRSNVPFLSADEPMSHYDFASSPFRFSRQLTRWDKRSVTAAINCFADGGTNVHAILETCRESSARSTRTPRPSPRLERTNVSTAPSAPEAGESADLWTFRAETERTAADASGAKAHDLPFWESVH